MFHLKIDLFLIYLIIVNNYVRSAPEPLCSKFSYDEQLLEKMVRVEFNVNNMEKNMLETEMSMRKTEETMQETDRSMRETHANMMDTERKIQEAQQKMAETHADIMTAQKKMQENLADINENIKLLEQKDEMLEAKRGKDVVAFRAHKVADKSVADNQVFVFTKVVLNEGSGYSSTSGYFTAPVSGIYFFNSQLCGLENKFIQYAIVSQGDTRTSGLFMPNKYGTCTSFSGVVSMGIGERAWVTINSNGSPSSDMIYDDSRNWNYFSGFLIR